MNKRDNLSRTVRFGVRRKLVVNFRSGILQIRFQESPESLKALYEIWKNSFFDGCDLPHYFVVTKIMAMDVSNDMSKFHQVAQFRTVIDHRGPRRAGRDHPIEKFRMKFLSGRRCSINRFRDIMEYFFNSAVNIV